MRAGRVLLLAAALLAVCAPSASGAVLRHVRVHTEAAYDPLQPVEIAFRPEGRLPRGGYYYAVAVLGSREPGSETCAVSSDMARTPYGYPHGERRITLTLYPAGGAAWCTGATYSAAVYAVPHAPRCRSTGRCAGRSAECGGEYEPCPLKGVLPVPKGPSLPEPIDRSARIVARLRLRFPAGPPSVPIEAVPGLLAEAEESARRNGDPAPTEIEAVRTTLGAWGRLQGGSFGPTLASEQIYLVAERGRFVCGLCSRPPRAKAPAGSVITLEVPVLPGGLSGFGLASRYPNLGLLGDPVPLGS